MHRFYVGLDLGQAQDYTAIAVTERVPTRQEGQWQPTPAPPETPDQYHVRHLQRFRLGTTYPAIVAEVARMLQNAPLRGGAVDLVVDQTGVGRAVVDLMVAAGLRCVPVTITGGDSMTREDSGYRVPKRDLVSTSLVLLQASRLKFAEGMAEGPTIARELLAFDARITAAANVTFSAREGAHDDLVLAVALACWYGECKDAQPGRGYSGPY